MGLYKKEVFKKDNNGNWQKQSSTIEKAPHDIGRWQRSCELEKKSDLRERSYITHGTTRTGINKKVQQVRSYFGNEKVVRTLITTANKLPKDKNNKR